MTSRTITLAAWGTAVLAILLWCGFWLLIFQISKERAQYASLQADVALQENRERTSAQLRTLIRDTKNEREALEQLSHTDVLAAAATIEAAGRAAGADVTIKSADTTPLAGKQTKVLQEVIVVADAEGSFAALMRAASLFESLPFPSEVTSYQLTQEPRGRGAGVWVMTARIRIITPSNSSS